MTAIYWTATVGWNTPARCNNFSYVYAVGAGYPGTAGQSTSGTTGAYGGNGGGGGGFTQSNNVSTSPGQGWSVYVAGPGGAGNTGIHDGTRWQCMSYSAVTWWGADTGVVGGGNPTGVAYGGGDAQQGGPGAANVGGGGGFGGVSKNSPWGASGNGTGGVGAITAGYQGQRVAVAGTNAVNWGAGGGGGGGGVTTYPNGAAGGAAYQGIVQLDYNQIPAPTISSITPNSGTIYGNQQVGIFGTNLTNPTAVTFGGTASTFISPVNDGQANCYTPARSAGVVDVALTTIGGTATLPASFTYRAQPGITGISPNRGPIAGGTSVVITGTDFNAATAVTFGGTAATSYVVNSNTQITAVAPAHAAGNFNVVVVTTSAGTGSYYYYAYIPAPTITSCNPAIGNVLGGLKVNIAGAGFVDVSSVTFGGAAATNVVVTNENNLTCNTPARPVGPATIVVNTPYGSGSLVNGFSYRLNVYFNLPMLGF
jgi:IPT/TIG domain